MLSSSIFWYNLITYALLNNIYLFKLNRYPRSRHEICSKLTTRLDVVLWGVYCKLWTYYTPFSCFSHVDFELAVFLKGNLFILGDETCYNAERWNRSSNNHQCRKRFYITFWFSVLYIYQNNLQPSACCCDECNELRDL